MMNEKEKLLAAVAEKIPDFHHQKLSRAIDLFSENVGQKKRRNGEKYFAHLQRILKMVLEIAPDEKMLIAAFLYKIPDRDKNFQKKCRELFGPEICDIVKSLDKIDAAKNVKKSHQMTIFREMFLAMAKDFRAVVLLLAFRLENLRTIDIFPPEKQRDFARETLFLYAPIASRLGIFRLKAPLEDLSFRILEPEKYQNLFREIKKHETSQKKSMAAAKRTLENLLKKEHFSAEVSGRAKHLWSIFQKMKKKGRESISEIYDIFALRIVVEKVEECYRALGVVHEHFTPLPRRFKDYIAVPKANGYQSLHTTVAGLGTQSLPVEIQIRTREMNDAAEFGIAAHWHYKEKGSQKIATKKKWIQNLGEWEESLRENGDEPFSERIYAITPKGDIKDLPAGATAIDFAFSIHDDIGLRLKSAKINGKNAPIFHLLENGDVIEIATHREPKPNQNWISKCATTKAKNALRAFFRKKDDATLLRDGKNLLNKILVRNGGVELDQNLSALKNYLGKKRSKKDREEILIRIGNGSISPSSVAKNLLEYRPPKKEKSKKPAANSQNPEKIIVAGDADFPIKMANCCHPKKGDGIVGFVTRGNRITIHRDDCRLLKNLDSRRFLDAHFAGHAPPKKATIETLRLVRDRAGLLSDVVSLLSAAKINVVNVSFPEQTFFRGKMRFEIEYHDFDQLEKVIEEIEEIPEISSVTKIN